MAVGWVVAMCISRGKWVIIVIFGIALSLGMLFYLKWTQENPILDFLLRKKSLGLLG
jgi:hypothetical protein